jgi:hypothetical protein
MTSCLGLTVIGVTVAVTSRAYVHSALQKERRLLDEIHLESAANTALADLAAGQFVNLAPFAREDLSTGKLVSLTLSAPETKIDLYVDQPEDVEAVLQRHGLTRQYLDEAGLEEWFSRLGATPAQEDCLRRELTLGRAPEEVVEVTSEEAMTIRQIGVGDQVDIRAAIAGIAGDEVLWVRARRSSLPDQPWAIHDWRRLSIARRALCHVRYAPGSVADDLTGR